jgi:hypothetical protein
VKFVILTLAFGRKSRPRRDEGLRTEDRKFLITKTYLNLNILYW